MDVDSETKAQMGWPKVYDVTTDELKFAEQSDIDAMMQIIQAWGQAQHKRKEENYSAEFLGRRLAVYPNPMRDDGVFIAEDKPIEPWPNVRGPNGEPLYPTTPSGLNIGYQVSPALAAELVRRWNLCQERGL